MKREAERSEPKGVSGRHSGQFWATPCKIRDRKLLPEAQTCLSKLHQLQRKVKTLWKSLLIYISLKHTCSQYEQFCSPFLLSGNKAFPGINIIHILGFLSFMAFFPIAVWPLPYLWIGSSIFLYWAMFWQGTVPTKTALPQPHTHTWLTRGGHRILAQIVMWVHLVQLSTYNK